MPIKIVDLFAGPGGLGEGFSALSKGKIFKILISAEMESSAHETLRLRSFFRLIHDDPKAIANYYAFCNGEAEYPFNIQSQAAWDESGLEARQLTLGDPTDNAILDSVLDAKLPVNDKWVLIGGPPCQAYSLVGRSRNIGTADYRPENDHRHFLYREYLRIIRDRRPQVFVMENVKGILSSKVGGKKIFQDILRDLSDPDGVFGESRVTPGYRIHSLVTSTFYESGMNPTDIDPRDFIVRSEEFGIPQARHRVILLGVRTDIKANFTRLMAQPKISVREVLCDLPPLRSRISKCKDTSDEWAAAVKTHLVELAEDAQQKDMKSLAASLRQSAMSVRTGLQWGALRFPRKKIIEIEPHAATWYLDSKLKFWLNHEARSHMTSDLRRYGYAATYAALHGHSPKGHAEFSLAGLAPNHENWESGKFSDRFRVQRFDAPATTVTSHIAKDGHYFIHPDPTQCRSLTVREAARLQTFPDNYFFQGNRTQQYHQVGNAVPPRLAIMIAKIVSEILV
ncbi:DNA cytosine methyltransferase [Undibacterium sp. Ren11W]|uniref:DNA cytosine methyltransferase n=1 Tax=Undibacterium sp. Ren11W TaxID=3413045 RepID=UPI003BEF54FB